MSKIFDARLWCGNKKGAFVYINEHYLAINTLKRKMWITTNLLKNSNKRQWEEELSCLPLTHATQHKNHSSKINSAPILARIRYVLPIHTTQPPLPNVSSLYSDWCVDSLWLVIISHLYITSTHPTSCSYISVPISCQNITAVGAEKIRDHSCNCNTVIRQHELIHNQIRR